MYNGILSNQTDIREGFIITSVNHEKVKTVNELKNKLQGIEGGVFFAGVYENYPGEVYYAFGLE